MSDTILLSSRVDLRNESHLLIENTAWKRGDAQKMQRSWLESSPMEMASFGDGWEGRVVEGRFPLLKWMGGTENSALYFTVLQGLQEAIIQLIQTDEAQAKTDIAQWDFAKSLSHPHLAKLLASGRCVLEGKRLVYVVGESSTTNLAKMIEGERLEADRAKQIFNAIVDALMYLHSNGVVHGHLNPTNIHFADSKPRLLLTDLLIAGTVRRSISAAGNYDAPELRHGEATAASDTWSLGLTIWEAMTLAPPSWDLWRDQEPDVPASLPSPFREIVRDCLRVDPTRRGTLVTVQERLNAREATPLPEAPPPVKLEQPVIDSPSVNDQPPVNHSTGESDIPRLDQPEPRFSAPEEIEAEGASEPALFSGTLTHFEEAHLPRSRAVPYSVVLVAMIAIGAFWFVREYKAGILSKVTEKAAAISAPSPDKQAIAPAQPTPDKTQPALNATGEWFC